MNKRALIVDDEPKILEVVASLLESKGFNVVAASTGRQALAAFDGLPFSIVILDLMLPDISGEEVCREMRKKSSVPIIMLTAKAAESDEADGLNMGADDYITKPFGLMALYARVQAVMRRAADSGPGLVIDGARGEVLLNGKPVALTHTEMKILQVLASVPGRIFSRDEIIASALGDEFEGYDRTVDSHIKNIRKKLEDDPRKPLIIKTVSGMGYKL